MAGCQEGESFCNPAILQFCNAIIRPSSTMSDPHRPDGARSLVDGSSNADREAKIEQLLLAGLDHYFAGQYDHAINVWTRALFLDRSHARARAYIERARSALAERQRQGEELLQGGVDALHRGDPVGARRLLTAAVGGGAAPDEALALLDRLDRLERNSEATPVQALPKGRAPRPAPPASAPVDAPRGNTLAWIAVGVFAAAAAIFVVATGPAWRPLLFPAPVAPAATAVPSSIEPTLPLPRRGEVALARARAFSGAGRLRDALAALDLVRPTDPEKADADRLRGVLQHQIIELASPPEGLNTDLTARHLP